jgi:hypothetical protein
VGRVIKYEIGNFSDGCLAACYSVFVLGQRDIATVDDEDHAHFILSQILGALKEGKRSNPSRLSWSLDYACVQLVLAFIDTDVPEWQSKWLRGYSSYYS